MIIKLSNGTAEIKNFCPRKVTKSINDALYSDSNVNLDDKGKANMSGMNFNNLDKANDAAMLGMITKLTINGVDMPIIIETLDDMNTNDVDLIIAEINKITKKEIPEV